MSPLILQLVVRLVDAGKHYLLYLNLSMKGILVVPLALISSLALICVCHNCRYFLLEIGHPWQSLLHKTLIGLYPVPRMQQKCDPHVGEVLQVL